MKKTLAIVGSGVSAMTCAHYLHDEYDISIFEKNDYLGGHTHTHTISENGKTFTIDTGFIVFNLETYGNLLQLFTELGVEKRKSDMSFSVYNQDSGLQYSGRSYAHLFAQKRNLFSPRYWRFLAEISKFFRVATEDRTAITGSRETIRDYCRRRGLSDFFVDNYLAPMTASVWSAPQSDVHDFPVSLLLPFFNNHGLLGLDRLLQWYTVRGGSDAYIKKIVAGASLDIHLNEGAKSATLAGDGVELTTVKQTYRFDRVILACHAPESLAIAAGLSAEKRQILGAYGYTPNRAVLHTDRAVMPPLRSVWASWNQVIGHDAAGRPASSTVYWVNQLQGQDTATDYFISINPFQPIDPGLVVKAIDYDHPNFTVENFALQERLPELNRDTRIFFAGAYFGYGFHEDGVKSGLRVVEALKQK